MSLPKKIIKTVCLSVCMPGMMLMTGCAGFWVSQLTTTTSGGSTNGDYVYVANAGSNSVSAYDISSAALTTISGSPYTLTYAPTSLVVTVPNTYLYVGTSAGVYGYSIGTSGALTTVENGIALQSCGSSGGISSLDVSPDGQWLVELASDGLTICVGKINTTTGALTAGTPVTYSVTGAVPSQIKVAPSAAYVFAALGSGGTIVFPFTTSSGTISTTAQILNYAANNFDSDNALAIDANTAYVYIARTGSNNPGVWVYQIAASNGALTSVNQTGSGVPYVSIADPYTVSLSKSGTYLYAGDYYNGVIYGYTAATGQLTATPQSPYTTGDEPVALAYDNSSNYMIAVCTGGSPAVQLLAFDSSNPGRLYAASSATAGTDPIALAVTH